MRTLHARTRFPARMRGRSTRGRDFRRECEDDPRESAIFRQECEDAPRESAISGENARTLHARARFSARMRGRSTRERDFQREFLHRGPPTLHVVGLLFYYFSNSTVTALASKNAKTLHARARFPARMRGRSTRERAFRRECEDASRESAISGENARTLHARVRFPARM